MPTEPGPVLVCKEYSDSYAAELSNRGFEPHFLQILETRFVNEDLLRHTIEEGPDKRFDGVIVTSSRAAEAWINASSSIQETQDISTSFNAKWNNAAFYVVGKATATAFQSSSIPPSRILGADSGTGEALARFIVSNHDIHHDGDYGVQPSFLLLTGDKNRETIPAILTEAGFNFRKLQVYETTATSNLDTNMASAMEAMKGGQESPDTKPWIVFFSPSTADVVISAMQQNPLSSFRIATIGPTTSAHIRSLNYDVCVSSPKPDPGVLAESLLVYAASV